MSAPAAAAPAELVELARALVRVDTANPPAGERPAAELVAAFLAGCGADVQLQPVGAGRANLIARIRGRGERPALLFSGHLDTVPVGPDRWRHPPLEGVVRDGRLHGRGSADMKGAVAAMALALRELARGGRVPAGDVVLALTAGEEVDSCGAHLLAASGLVDDAGMLVVGEMTGLDVGCATKGLLWVAVRTVGERGHGSLVGRDANAIARLLDWLHPLDALERLVAGSHELLGRGSVSVNMLAAGDAPNVVPAAATATIDVRTLPGHDHGALLDGLRARGGAAVEVLRDGIAVATAPDDPLVRTATAVVGDVLGRAPAVRGLPYLTDASAFAARLGPLPTVVLGPGEEAAAHAVDESVALDALAAAAVIYRRLALELHYD